eukprot:TRINITY_DN3151_c1_g1_i5.p1 TRINITY_DN3151_c1_g1~~TRINITY_DN3151_c1_g1_i5.p1  ORF type:complete len:247 (+),score=29.42 TRINITY_DN3151_c1_g1_i5:169-909(+)
MYPPPVTSEYSSTHVTVLLPHFSESSTSDTYLAPINSCRPFFTTSLLAESVCVEYPLFVPSPPLPHLKPIDFARIKARKSRKSESPPPSPTPPSKVVPSPTKKPTWSVTSVYSTRPSTTSSSTSNSTSSSTHPRPHLERSSNPNPSHSPSSRSSSSSSPSRHADVRRGGKHQNAGSHRSSRHEPVPGVDRPFTIEEVRNLPSFTVDWLRQIGNLEHLVFHDDGRITYNNNNNNNNNNNVINKNQKK